VLELILNHDGIDDEPLQRIQRVLFKQVLLQLDGIEPRELDRYYYTNGSQGVAIEIDTDEGDAFGSIYITVSNENPPEAESYAFALAHVFARELGLKVINPLEGKVYDINSLPTRF